MKTTLKLSLIAGLLVAAGVAYSQAPMRGQCDPMMMGQGGMYGQQGMHHGRMGNMDPAKMQAMMEKRHAALKVQLKLTPAQEPAWTAFNEATKLPKGMMETRPDPAEMAKLPTPERLDKMKTLHTQRMGEMTTAMDKHAEAVKTFYAVLTPEQQKVFDANAMQRQGRAGGPGAGKGPMMPKQ